MCDLPICLHQVIVPAREAHDHHTAEDVIKWFSPCPLFFHIIDFELAVGGDATK